MTKYAVIETRTKERLVSFTEEPPPIGSVPGQTRDGNELVSYSIVPVTSGQRLDGGRWPL